MMEIVGRRASPAGNMNTDKGKTGGMRMAMTRINAGRARAGIVSPL